MGSLSIRKTDAGLDFNGEASLAGAKLASAFSALYPSSTIKLNTVGDFKLNAKSTGKSAREVIDGLRGWVSLDTGKGSLSGADFNRLLTAGNDEEDTGVLTLSGETSFDTMKGNFIFNQGAVWIRGVELTNKALHAKLTGRADLASGGLALRVRIGKTGADAAPQEAYLFVGGVISSPLVTRDRQAGGPADQ